MDTNASGRPGHAGPPRGLDLWGQKTVPSEQTHPPGHCHRTVADKLPGHFLGGLWACLLRWEPLHLQVPLGSEEALVASPKSGLGSMTWGLAL